jgi:hypothetical protein
MTFTDVEKATVLAALRLWQLHQASLIEPLSYETRGRLNNCDDIAADAGTPLDADAIDDLCERINCA